jgi:hypothetical protein
LFVALARGGGGRYRCRDTYFLGFSASLFVSRGSVRPRAPLATLRTRRHAVRRVRSPKAREGQRAAPVERSSGRAETRAYRQSDTNITKSLSITINITLRTLSLFLLVGNKKNKRLPLH